MIDGSSRQPRRAHPAGEDARRCRTCWSSATTTSRTAPSASTSAGAKIPSATSRSTTSSSGSRPRLLEHVDAAERLGLETVVGRLALRRTCPASPTTRSPTTAMRACSAGSPRPTTTKALVLERTSHTITVMNLYPYGSGHLMVAPLRHVARVRRPRRRRERSRLRAGAAARGARDPRRVRPRRRQRRRQPRPGRGRRRSRASARARAAALERRHQLHDVGRARPGSCPRACDAATTS